MNTDTKPVPFEFNLDPDTQLKLLTQITSGLLASGHFSEPGQNWDEPGATQLLAGIYLDENDKKKRYLAVVEAAEHVLHFLIRSVEQEKNA